MTNAVSIAQSGSNNQTMRNRIINGNMVINQRSWSGNAVEFGYTLDRWITFVGGANQWSVSQNAGSVTPPAGFTNYLGVTSLAATTPAAGDRNLLCQMIEGFNIADWGWGTVNAQPVTLSFWVRSSLTGTFGASINSTDQSVAATFSYTISAANTWEYKTITVQGPTTSPANWNTTNGRGLWLFFDMGTGANFALNTTWGSNAKYTIGGSRTNVIGTNGATWYLTGVQIEEGTAASPFEYRLYSTELSLCQRYYLRYQLTASFAFVGRTLDGNRVQLNFPLRNQMRTSPSLISSGITAVNNVYFGTSIASPNGTQTYALTGHESVDIGGILIEGGGTYTANQISTAQISGSIAYSAEL
jgi:hypothetical protein